MPNDTPENRQVLIEVANNPAALLGVDRFGTRWAASDLPDGRQIWVQMRGDRITNGGINHHPRNFAHGLGLSRPLRSRGIS